MISSTYAIPHDSDDTLRKWQHHPRYLRSIIAGGRCVDIEGHPVEAVSDEERYLAFDELAYIKYRSYVGPEPEWYTEERRLGMPKEPPGYRAWSRKNREELERRCKMAQEDATNERPLPTAAPSDEWELVDSSSTTFTPPTKIVTRRLAVPGGWLYRVSERDHKNGHSVHLCFVPEPRGGE
jgi:hypothetical protein